MTGAARPEEPGEEPPRQGQGGRRRLSFAVFDGFEFSRGSRGEETNREREFLRCLEIRHARSSSSPRRIWRWRRPRPRRLRLRLRPVRLRQRPRRRLRQCGYGGYGATAATAIRTAATVYGSHYRLLGPLRLALRRLLPARPSGWYNGYLLSGHRLLRVRPLPPPPASGPTPQRRYWPAAVRAHRPRRDQHDDDGDDGHRRAAQNCERFRRDRARGRIRRSVASTAVDRSSTAGAVERRRRRASSVRRSSSDRGRGREPPRRAGATGRQPRLTA